jgi:hypothetical protein
MIIDGDTIIGQTSDENSFIAKYDISGNFIWSKTAGYSLGIAMCSDFEGNVYITGNLLGINDTVFGLTLD